MEAAEGYAARSDGIARTRARIPTTAEIRRILKALNLGALVRIIGDPS
jgi:hypothetical protein